MKALRYGTRSQGISQFYLQTPRSSANEMNHTFAFPVEAGTHLLTPEGWKAGLALGGSLVTYWNKCPAPGIEPGHIAHLSTNRARRRLTLLLKANALTTTQTTTAVNLTLT